MLACLGVGAGQDPCAAALSASYPALLLLTTLSLAPAAFTLLVYGPATGPCMLEMDERMDVDGPEPGPSRSHPSAGPSEEFLPFPGEIIDGKHAVRFLNIAGQKKPVLVDWCREFRLPKSGTMKDLTARLREFSADSKRWESLLPGATKPHRNARSSTSRANVRLSSVRRELLIRGTPAPDQGPTPVRHVLPTQRSVDNRTAAAKAELFDWAEEICRTYPYDPPDSPHRQPSASRAVIPSASSIPYPLNSDLAYLKDQIGLVTTHLGIVSSGTRLDGPSHQPAPTPSPIAAPASPSVQEPSKPARVYSITLAGGKVVEFTADAIPTPPAVTFSSSLSRLIAMWDDTSPEWRGSSPIKLLDQPIALKYWSQVYHAKPEQWAGLRRKWSDWKMIMDYWGQTTPKDFWAEFEVNGKQVAYTTIIDRLRAARKERDRQDADAARKQYASNFDQVFIYEKGGKMYVMTDISAIAKRYRELQ